MELKFQQSYLEKHSAYYTAQFPILSQVRTHKHTLSCTQRIHNEAAATKQSHRQAQWYKNKQATTKKAKDSYYVRMVRGRVVTIHMHLHKEETSFTPFKDVHHANRCYHCGVTRLWCGEMEWILDRGGRLRVIIPPIALSCNCNGRVQSGTVFVSVLICYISQPGPRCCCSSPFHLTVLRDSVFCPDLSELRVLVHVDEPEAICRHATKRPTTGISEHLF